MMHFHATNIRAGIDTFIQQHPWVSWVILYALGMLYFIRARLQTLPYLIELYSDTSIAGFGFKCSALFLGALEDLVLLTYILIILWAFDSVVKYILYSKDTEYPRQGFLDCFKMMPMSSRFHLICKRVTRFIVHMIIWVITFGIFATDVVFIQTRHLRFTFEWIKLYFHDGDAAKQVQIASDEQQIIHSTVFYLIVYAFILSFIAMVWMDLSLWTPLNLIAPSVFSQENEIPSPNEDDISTFQEYETMEQGDLSIYEKDSIAILGERTKQPVSPQHPIRSISSSNRVPSYNMSSQNGQKTKPSKQANSPWTHTHTISSEHATQRLNIDCDIEPQLVTTKHRLMKIGIIITILCATCILYPILVLLITKSSDFAKTQIALNTTLNEAYRIILGVQFYPPSASGDLKNPNIFISAQTESYNLYGDDTLYRKTTGFKGEKAFDVRVDPDDLPNVLIITVESFRHRDSKYLVGDNLYLLGNDSNVSVTPNFDRWAKRGIAFPNFWSGYRTSRSVESVLYGQIPYDSVTVSGTTDGKEDIKLSGLPQFFKKKGYEPSFTCGCRVDYDQWDRFLPSHGFEEIIAMDDFKKRCEKDLGIQKEDWNDIGPEAKRRQMPYWGVHDDLAFAVLGNILTNKTDAQKQRVEMGQPKKPFFIDHYTISSHVPYWEQPKWWDNYPKPNFTSLLPPGEHNNDTFRYLSLRYFQDLALGKFLDRMKAQGILDDTIVFIVGDHGQAPELGCDNFEPDQESTTHVAAAMIAEGRLGEHAGMIFSDAAQQYDILNTFMDIIGVPENGFDQTSVGRSLLRKLPWGKNIVWTNNPTVKMGAVRGNERIVYDRAASKIEVYNSLTDHFQKHDLYPAMDEAKKHELETIRQHGRDVQTYFKKRWDKKCLIAATCEE